MDPRPYNFEYRRPRLANPTFQSSKFYDSIFSTKNSFKDVNPNRARNPESFMRASPQQGQPELKRANSTDLSAKTHVELQGIGSYRYGSKGGLEQAQKGGRSKMANIGTHLLRNSSMDQTQVYKRQEKEFNIINFYQKEFKPNLRQFPKLSLENRLLELGKGRSSE